MREFWSREHDPREKYLAIGPCIMQNHRLCKRFAPEKAWPQRVFFINRTIHHIKITFSALFQGGYVILLHVLFYIIEIAFLLYKSAPLWMRPMRIRIMQAKACAHRRVKSCKATLHFMWGSYYLIYRRDAGKWESFLYVVPWGRG